MEREKLNSRLGFILLSAGCAIGCGNVWKFPTMCGQNGGGAFVLIYFLCLVLLGLPVITMEFALGRASQASPVRMYQKLQRKGQKWHLHGYIALFGNFCLMAFYTVVTGWMMYYFVSFLTGNHEGLGFSAMLASPAVNVSYTAITVLIGFGVLCFKLQGGLERVTKYMMLALLVLLSVLAVRSMTLPGAREGLSFYLVPDLGKINGSVIVSAMNQAFFTLSVGIGSMAIFGSYIGKDRSLLGESVNVIALDTVVAITAGLIIFPACFTYDQEVSEGAGLLFNTMATVFNNMEGGRWWGTIFFLFMVFAALSTVFAVFENILACVRELTGLSRPIGCLVCGVLVFLLAMTTALGFSVWSGFSPFAEGSSFMDLWDFLVSVNILPVGSMIICLFCCNSRYGWGFENFMAEANEGKGLKVRMWMKPLFTYIVPIVVLGLYVVALVTFKWR